MDIVDGMGLAIVHDFMRLMGAFRTHLFQAMLCGIFLNP